MADRPRKGGGEGGSSKGGRPPKGRGAEKGRGAKKGRGAAKKSGATRSKVRGPAKARGAPAKVRAPQPRGPRPVVAIFAKAPIPGQVKTRLTPALRAEEAADLYRALLLDTIEVVESTGARVTVAFTPSTARRPLERLLGRRRHLLAQPPGDLGARLEGVLGLLQEGGGKRVLLVGSDCPGLTAERIRQAWHALESVPVVLGPALDGGFYLLGVSRAAPGLLRDVPWSTGKVLETTRARLHELGLAVQELAEERDLDTPRDLFEWFAVAREAGLESAYPRTWKVLHSLMSPRRFAELEGRLAESH